MSTRVTSLAIALAMTPEPVQSSTADGRCGPAASDVSCSMAHPVMTSVSGRGTKTPANLDVDAAEVRSARQMLNRDPLGALLINSRNRLA